MNKDLHCQVTRIFPIVLVTLFFIAFSCSSAAAGPVQGGSIRGKVVADIPDHRKALPGVVVTLSGERLGEKKLQSISDMEGQYDFPGLIAGDYTIVVEYSGFKKYEKTLSVQ